MDFIVGIISLVFAVFLARAVWRAFPARAEPAKPTQMMVSIFISDEDATDMPKVEVEIPTGTIDFESSTKDMGNYIASIEKICNNKVVVSFKKKASLNNQP